MRVHKGMKRKNIVYNISKWFDSGLKKRSNKRLVKKKTLKNFPFTTDEDRSSSVETSF